MARKADKPAPPQQPAAPAPRKGLAGKTPEARARSLANLKKMQPGESGNPAGRPKKIYTVLKKTGYSRDDIITAFKELAFYPAADLKKLFEAEGTPIIVKVVAKALAEAAKAGDLHKIKDVLEYVLGKARQRIEMTGEDGGPILTGTDSDIDYTKLSDGALREIAAARTRPYGSES